MIVLHSFFVALAVAQIAAARIPPPATFIGADRSARLVLRYKDADIEHIPPMSSNRTFALCRVSAHGRQATAMKIRGGSTAQQLKEAAMRHAEEALAGIESHSSSSVPSKPAHVHGRDHEQEYGALGKNRREFDVSDAAAENQATPLPRPAKWAGTRFKFTDDGRAFVVSAGGSTNFTHTLLIRDLSFTHTLRILYSYFPHEEHENIRAQCITDVKSMSNVNAQQHNDARVVCAEIGMDVQKLGAGGHRVATRELSSYFTHTLLILYSSLKYAFSTHILLILHSGGRSGRTWRAQLREIRRVNR
jgi:hypothetical protein